MAIDKEKLKNVIENMEEIIKKIEGSTPTLGHRFIREKVIDPLLNDLKDLAYNSRPPVFMLMGRSGHGKSSLINAITGKNTAFVSDIEPGSIGSESYFVDFPGKYSAMEFVDTRGVFETTAPVGAEAISPLELLKEEIIKKKPDILIHVINAKEIRTLENDLLVFKDLNKQVVKKIGYSIPVVIVLTHIDLLGKRSEWPIEDHPAKAGKVKEALDYMSKKVLNIESVTPIDSNSLIKGYRLKDEAYIAIVPVCAEEGENWNIDTLSALFGQELPDEALLDFTQGRGNLADLRRFSSKIINTFSGAASMIGATPIPVSDIAILVPLQILLITIIAGLAGREAKSDNAMEFLAAMGIDVGVGYGLKLGAQQLIKLIPIPFAVNALSGSLAATGTYGIGKSAEYYFFDNQLRKPNSFKYNPQEK